MNDNSNDTNTININNIIYNIVNNMNDVDHNDNNDDDRRGSPLGITIYYIILPTISTGNYVIIAPMDITNIQELRSIVKLRISKFGV